MEEIKKKAKKREDREKKRGREQGQVGLHALAFAGWISKRLYDPTIDRRTYPVDVMDVMVCVETTIDNTLSVHSCAFMFYRTSLWFWPWAKKKEKRKNRRRPILII